MSLLFKMLSKSVIDFLPRRKRLLISRLQSPSAVILEPQKIKSLTVSIVFPSICHEVMGPDAMILFSECWVLHQLFYSPLTLSSRGSSALQLFFAFCSKGGMICVSEVIDISPCNLDSSLCFIQPSVSQWCTRHISSISRVTIYSFDILFPNLEPVFCSMSRSNCCFLSCIEMSQEAGQAVWYFHLFKNFPQFVVIHTVKGFGAVSKAKVDVFLELSCFFHDPADVGNLISGSSAFSKTSLNIREFTEAWLGEFWALLY